jgi:hypothetical protein
MSTPIEPFTLEFVPPEVARARAMARALGSLLDRTPRARASSPHLVALEKSLVKSGLDVLNNASLPLLTKISVQLAQLPECPDDAALEALQSALLSSMARRRLPAPASPPTPVAAAVGQVTLQKLGDHGVVEVSEVSHSTFMAIAMSEPTRPMTLPAPFAETEPQQSRFADTVPMTVRAPFADTEALPEPG